jgi:hypothetical protein
MQNARHVELIHGHVEGLGQRRLDFFVEQRHDSIENVDQIE